MIGEPDVNTLISKLKVQQLKQPNDGRWPFYQGMVFQVQGKYGKAINAFNESIKIEPTDVAYYNITNCCNELGDYEQALDNINKAMENKEIMYYDDFKGYVSKRISKRGIIDV